MFVNLVDPIKFEKAISEQNLDFEGFESSLSDTTNNDNQEILESVVSGLNQLQLPGSEMVSCEEMSNIIDYDDVDITTPDLVDYVLNRQSEELDENEEQSTTSTTKQLQNISSAMAVFEETLSENLSSERAKEMIFAFKKTLSPITNELAQKRGTFKQLDLCDWLKNVSESSGSTSTKRASIQSKLAKFRCTSQAPKLTE